VVVVRQRGGRLCYEPVNACITLLGQIDGAELITVEDLAEGGALHPVQAALARDHGSQCGFCTPGIVMSLFAHYHEAYGVTDRQTINDVLAGNLCRCTGYRPIVQAALDVCGSPADDRFSRRGAERLAALRALDDGADVMAGDEMSFFAAPGSEAALARLYAQHPDATIVAGATDVGLWITKKLMPLQKIIHVGRVAGFDAIVEDGQQITLGATATLVRAAPVIGTLDPDIAEVMRRFGSTQVRTAGTVGGNIANGSPIGDIAPMLIALGAQVELRHGDVIRQFPLEQFFLDYGKQDRKPGEFVRRLTVPKLKSGAHFRAFKITKRPDEDISAVLAAFHLTVADGRIGTARVAFGGMAGIPKRAAMLEQKLTGLELGDTEGWRAAAQAVDADFKPLTDLRASATYRSAVAANLVIKVLAELAGAAADRTRVNNRRTIADAAE
jgi:xanthine dehydrogenase small subunit